MTDKEKIKLAELVIDFVKEAEREKPKAIFVGRLKIKQGINGFKPMEIGTPVFDDGQRYFIIAESLDGKRALEIPYYKETLRPYINFLLRVYV